MADDPQQRKRSKSWKIVDGKLPSDLRGIFRENIDEHSQVVYPDPMLAPWIEFPEYSRSSMGWRMGAGEDYMSDFCNWIGTLSGDERAAYQRENEEPTDWNGFYEGLEA